MNTDIFRNKKINFHKRLRDGNYAVYGEKHHISFKELLIKNPYDKIKNSKNPNINYQNKIIEVKSVIIVDKDVNKPINNFSSVKLAAIYYKLSTDAMRLRIQRYTYLPDLNHAIYSNKNILTIEDILTINPYDNLRRSNIKNIKN